MPLRREEKPDGLPESLNLPPRTTKVYVEQGFPWPTDDMTKLVDGRVGPGGYHIEAYDYLSEQKIPFTERYPGEGSGPSAAGPIKHSASPGPTADALTAPTARIVTFSVKNVTL